MSRHMSEAWDRLTVEGERIRNCSLRHLFAVDSIHALSGDGPRFMNTRSSPQGGIRNVNSFDQWDIELDRQLAPPLAEALTGNGAGPADLDSSTAGLLAAFRELGFSTHA